MFQAYILLILGWSFFYFLHSLLAAEWIKARFQHMGFNDQQYRIFYNAFAVLTLMGIIYLSLVVSSHQVLSRRDWMITIGLLLAVWGVWIINLSFRYYDFGTFMGLIAEQQSPQLQKSGLMKMVRHPIYLGTLMILSGYFLFSPTSTALIIGLVSLIYVMIGIRLEEKKLIRAFGDEYREYQREVPMLIPFIKF